MDIALAKQGGSGICACRGVLGLYMKVRLRVLVLERGDSFFEFRMRGREDGKEREESRTG